MALPFTPVPTIDVIGGATVSTHGLFFFLGAIITYFLARRRLDDEGFAQVERAVPLMIVGSLIGGRLAFIVSYPEMWSSPTLWWRFWEGGMVSYGGLIGACLPLWFKTDRAVLDRLAAPMMVGWGIGRIGCLLSWYGEAGLPSDLPWAFVVDGVARHPAMAYLVATNLIGALILWRTPNAPLALLYFSLARFLVDGWREYEPAELLWASRAAATALGVVALLAMHSRGRFRAPPVEPI